MRLIDADEFFENFPELAIEPYINAPTVEPQTKLVANVTFNKEQLEEIVEKAKADILSQIERPQGEIVDNCDMNVFEPEKYMRGEKK